MRDSPPRFHTNSQVKGERARKRLRRINDMEIRVRAARDLLNDRDLGRNQTVTCGATSELRPSRRGGKLCRGPPVSASASGRLDHDPRPLPAPPAGIPAGTTGCAMAASRVTFTCAVYHAVRREHLVACPAARCWLTHSLALRPWAGNPIEAGQAHGSHLRPRQATFQTSKRERNAMTERRTAVPKKASRASSRASRARPRRRSARSPAAMTWSAKARPNRTRPMPSVTWRRTKPRPNPPAAPPRLLRNARRPTNNTSALSAAGPTPAGAGPAALGVGDSGAACCGSRTCSAPITPARSRLEA